MITQDCEQIVKCLLSDLADEVSLADFSESETEYCHKNNEKLFYLKKGLIGEALPGGFQIQVITSTAETEEEERNPSDFNLLPDDPDDIDNSGNNWSVESKHDETLDGIIDNAINKYEMKKFKEASVQTFDAFFSFSCDCLCKEPETEDLPSKITKTKKLGPGLFNSENHPSLDNSAKRDFREASICVNNKTGPRIRLGLSKRAKFKSLRNS